MTVKPFRGEDGLYYYLYVTENLVNKKIYVGVHSTDDLNDGYIGCGVTSDKSAKRLKIRSKSIFINSIVKYGYKSFKVIERYYFNTKREAYKAERFIVNKRFLELPHTLNMALGGKGGGVPKIEKQVIKEIIEVHGDIFDFSDFRYINIDRKSKVKCLNHGIFEITPRSLLLGHGCPICSGYRSEKHDILIRLKEVHGEEFSYDKLKFNNQNDKVDIYCNKHGYFKQKLSHHLNGSKCPKCKQKACIDMATGLEFPSLKEASIYLGIPVSTLHSRIKRESKINTIKYL